MSCRDIEGEKVTVHHENQFGPGYFEDMTQCLVPAVAHVWGRSSNDGDGGASLPAPLALSLIHHD